MNLIGHNPAVPSNQTTNQVIKSNNFLMNQEATTMFGFANSEDEAKMMNIQKGYTQAYILDRYVARFYYKQVDPFTGQTVNFKVYGYDEILPPEPEKPVTHNDLASLKDDIISQVAALLNEKKEDDICG